MKILFVGNSYTFYNHMPKMLEELLLENGIEAAVDSVTKGGGELCGCLKEAGKRNGEIKKLAANNEYDALFLQEQSCLPVVDEEKFILGVEGVIALVGAKRNILYSTWGRKEGSEKLSELSLTSEEMTEGLAGAYKRAAKKKGSEISPVGEYFARIRKNSSAVELYDPDKSHPSYVGSAAVTICHYKALTGRLPEKADSLGLDKDTLAILMGNI